MPVMFTSGRFLAQDDVGVPIIGSSLYTYLSGTTTPLATFTTATLGTPNTNPILTNARGEAQVWLGAGVYTFVLKDSFGVTIWSSDGIQDVATNALTQLSSSLSVTGGSSLIGFNPTLNYAVSTLGRHTADEFWNVCDFPWLATGDGTTNDTTAVQACITAAAAAGAGVYFPPRSKYQLDSLSLPTNTHLRGAGIDKSVLGQRTGANALAYIADPGSSTTYTSNITIEDLTLAGTVAADGFQEVLHILVTQGVSDLMIHRVKFTGWRGDGIYVGTGNERGQNPTQVRHNRSVRVLNCIFDGETKQNRNGISFIDCDGAWVERCYFTRCSQQTMPGCIDVEPDSGGTPNGSSSVIRNINITRNKFRDNAGAATISVNFPLALSSYTTTPYGINISGNDADNSASYNAATYGIGISINSLGAIDRTIAELGISIQDNTISSHYSPLLIRAVRGVDIVKNRFKQSKYSAEIGDSTATYNTLDVRFHGNSLYKISADLTVGGNGINIYAADNITISNKNLFDSCGKSDNTYNSNITLTTAGTKSNITVEDNTFYSPVANSNAWPVRRDAGVLSVGTTREGRNRTINVNGGLVSFVHDYITPDTYQTPALSNSWVAFGGSHQDPQYWKDSAGIVHLRGTLKSGSTTGGTTILSLPAGYRPGKILNYAVACNGAYGEVQIENTIGDLQVVTLGSNTRLSLNGISFKAEA